MNWNTKVAEIVGISGGYEYTGTETRYIPLVGTKDEEPDSFDSDATFNGNNNISRLLTFNFMTDSVMGVTVFTLVLDQPTPLIIATKTVNIDTANIIYKLDFTTGLEGASDTNEFSDLVSIGINPTTGGSSNNFSAIFEVGLF